MKTFTLTQEHIALLRHANISWSECECGAPRIDPKRPYGNSNMPGDIARVLDGRARQDETGEWPQAAEERYAQLHRETETALQIVLAAGTFEPGVYEADDYRRNWRKVKPV